MDRDTAAGGLGLGDLRTSQTSGQVIRFLNALCENKEAFAKKVFDEQKA